MLEKEILLQVFWRKKTQGAGWDHLSLDGFIKHFFQYGPTPDSFVYFSNLAFLDAINNTEVILKLYIPASY